VYTPSRFASPTRQRVELPDEAVASSIEEVKKLTGAERDRHKE
jgi:hypothetical protein